MPEALLVVVIKNNVVDQVYLCQSAEEQQSVFVDEAEDYGVAVCDAHFEDGYIELECGTSICITSAIPSEREIDV